MLLLQLELNHPETKHFHDMDKDIFNYLLWNVIHCFMYYYRRLFLNFLVRSVGKIAGTEIFDSA